MWRIIATCVIASVLAGCGLAARQAQAEKAAAITETVKAEVETCKAQYSELPKDAIARAKCFNAADTTFKQIASYPDLVDLRIAKRAEIAERVSAGKITRAEGVLEFSHMQTNLIDEEQKRSLADRSVRVQEISAAAAMAPTSCTRFGNTVTCF
jgi:hypothetical protein